MIASAHKIGVQI